MRSMKVSLCLISYNQEKFIEEAIEGVLNQDYNNLEIIISDDCSTDNTYSIIEKIVSKYKGGKKVQINRNKTNLGLVKHVNKVIEFATGDIILLSAGDDVSLCDRASNTVKYFEENETLQAVAFSTQNIDAEGKVIGENATNQDIIFSRNSPNYLMSCNMVTPGFGLAFRKSIFDEFGPLNDDCQTEDSTIRFRCILRGNVIYSAQKGLLYRIHGNNISAPVRIYNLRTEKIAKQFRSDLDKCRSFVTEEEYSILNLKIDYYKTYRCISEKIYNSSNKIVKSIFFLKRKWYTYQYHQKLNQYLSKI